MILAYLQQYKINIEKLMCFYILVVRNWKLMLKMLYYLQYYIKFEIFSEKYVKLCIRPIQRKLSNSVRKKLKKSKEMERNAILMDRNSQYC